MIRVRPGCQDDRVFVIDAWLQSYRTAHAAGLISMDTWSVVMWPQLERILDRPGVEIHVACEDSAPPGADIYGFLVCDRTKAPPVVHYIYCKAPYRRCGIATGLCRATGLDLAAPFVYVCRTALVSRLRHKIPRARFDPLCARVAPEPHHAHAPRIETVLIRRSRLQT